MNGNYKDFSAQNYTENKTKKCQRCLSPIPIKATVCPFCKKRQVKWKNFLIILLIFFIISLIFSLDSLNEEYSQTTNSKTTIQKETIAEKKLVMEKEPKEEQIVYTYYDVSEMLEDMDANPMRAESKYSDQYVEIVGRLTTIDSDGKYIALSPTENEYSFSRVICNIKTNDQKEKIIDMSINDVVEVKGKVISVGEVMGYKIDIDDINVK